MTPRALILMYHRVATLRPDEWNLCISPGVFREHMIELKRSARPMPLVDLAAALESGTAPPGAVAITFDDGCLDNLTTASPILQDLDLPATFFIPTERLAEPHEFWWDTLERVFSASSRPEPIHLTTDDGDTIDLRVPPDRSAAQRTIAGQIRRLNWPERDRIMSSITTWAGIETAPRDTHRQMLADEVQTLARRPGHHIGAHSVHHLALPALPPNARRSEMRESKETLEILLGSPVTVFAYPFGQVDPETMVIADELFSAAVAIEGACVPETSERLALPRVDGNLLDTAGLVHLLKSIG